MIDKITQDIIESGQPSSEVLARIIYELGKYQKEEVIKNFDHLIREDS